MTTSLTDVANQIQTYWAPVFTKQLRESLLLGGLVNKDYEGEIKKGGDTVKVSQINAPEGQLLTIGTDADSFESENVSTSQISIVANKRAVASYEFDDLVSLQSQIDVEGSECREALTYALNKQINDYLYGLISPSTSAPDHKLNSITTMDAAQLRAIRLLAAQAKWRKQPGWYALLDPDYYGQLMADATLGNKDYGSTDNAMVSGQIGEKKLGFTVFEDDSRSAKNGVFFHPDFLHLVHQTSVQVKISDLHAQKRFGYVMSVDIIFGAALGIEGSKKHIQVLGT